MVASMLESQRLTVRASEIRQRLNEIAGLAADAVTAEIRTESDKLTAEYGTVETQLRAAIVAEDGERKAAETRGGADDADAETRALRDLQGRASFGRFMAAYANQTPLDGAEKELAEHRGLSSAGNVIPWDALMPAGPAAAELRADQTTPGPTTGNPVGQQAIIQRVFARASLRRLGIPMPSVPAGQASFPVIGSGQQGAFVAPDAEKDAAAGSFNSNVLGPKRLQARVRFRIEDTMTTPGLDAALQEDLRLGLMDQADKQIVGAGTAQVRGLLATAANGGLADYADPGQTVDFAAAAAQAARGVDGLYAGGESEIAWCVGTATYEKLAGLIQGNDSTSATERLRRILRDFWTSAHVPAAAGNIQQGIVAKMGGDGFMNAVMPVWEGLKLTRDEITDAAAGWIYVTATAFYNFKLLRSGGFVRTKLKLA